MDAHVIPQPSLLTPDSVVPGKAIWPENDLIIHLNWVLTWGPEGVNTHAGK